MQKNKILGLVSAKHSSYSSVLQLKKLVSSNKTDVKWMQKYNLESYKDWMFLLFLFLQPMLHTQLLPAEIMMRECS